MPKHLAMLNFSTAAHSHVRPAQGSTEPTARQSRYRVLSYCRVRLRCGFETSISERTDSQTLMALKCRQTADSIIAPSPKRLVEPHILPSLIGKGDGMSSARSSIQSGSCGYLIEPLLSTPCRAESTEPVIFSLSSALA